MKENEDYELITHATLPDTWAIRIIKGDYIESILAIGSIAFNEVKDHWSFNFDVVETPDPDLVHTDNVDLQQTVARIIEDIIENGMEEGYIDLKPRDTIELKN